MTASNCFDEKGNIGLYIFGSRLNYKKIGNFLRSDRCDVDIFCNMAPNFAWVELGGRKWSSR